jgi:hypothetical protein
VAGSGGVECLAMLETGLAHQGGLIVTKLETFAMRLSDGLPFLHSYGAQKLRSLCRQARMSISLLFTA